MAVVQLADIIEPSIFTEYVVQKTTELSAFFASGIVAQTSEMDARTAAAADTFTVPFWNALSSDEPNVGSDNPATLATPLKIGAATQVAMKQRRNQSWSAMDIAGVTAGSDPMQQIVNGVAGYWARVFNKNIIEITKGVLADNVANDAGDMLNDIGTDAVGVPAAGELISADAIINTWAKLGDASGQVAAIAMHSVVYHRLQSQNLIDFIPTSEQNVMIPTYLGKRVVVDDTLPAVAGANRIKYTTVLFGTGAIGYGEGTPHVPTEVIRVPAAGNGEGQETLHNRRHFCFHPGGFKWLGGSLAGTTPTNAELALAANWDRVFAKKNIPLVFLKTNG